MSLIEVNSSISLPLDLSALDRSKQSVMGTGRDRYSTGTQVDSALKREGSCFNVEMKVSRPWRIGTFSH